MLASVTWEWDGLGDCKRYAPDMQSVTDYARKMRLLEQLACPTEADRGFFNTHIQDLGPHSTYRENLENLVRLRSGGAD